GTQSILAAKQATTIIPIVFALPGDPVATGLVASLARPGGNLTGLSSQAADLGAKRLETLREAVPGLRRLAIMGNAGNPANVLDMARIHEAARILGLDAAIFEIRRTEDIAPTFDAITGRTDALYIPADALINTNRIRINTLALDARLPTMHGSRGYVEAGGLMSYGVNFTDQFRRAADLVDKILRGAKPADIPVEQPTKFDLVINLTTAKALGLTIPESHLAALALDRKKLAAFSALSGGFLRFPIGDRRCNRTRASVGNAGGDGRPSLTNPTLAPSRLLHLSPPPATPRARLKKICRFFGPRQTFIQTASRLPGTLMCKLYAEHIL